MTEKQSERAIELIMEGLETKNEMENLRLTDNDIQDLAIAIYENLIEVFNQ